MPSAAERMRNNVRMGVFVTFAVILALIVIVLLTGIAERFTHATETWTVTFSVRSGVGHLTSGSEVRVGGIRLGEVVQLEPRYEPVFDEIDVFFRLDRNVRLYDDAVIVVSAPLIGAEAWIDIPHVGTPEAGSPPDRRLRGTDTEGLITALLGAEDAGRARELFDRVENMLGDVGQFAAFLATVPEEYDSRIVPIIEDVALTGEEVRDLARAVRQEHWPRWARSVDDIFDWAGRATGDVDAILAEGRMALTDSREILAENRPGIRHIVENIEESSDLARDLLARLESDTLDRVHALLETGQGGLDEAHAALQTMRDDYDGWAANINEVMANLNLTAQQLRLTSVEVRRSPWKLLYRPDARELEHELLYEAARSFAVAAADLKAASGTVNRLMERYGDEVIDDEAARQRILQALIDPLDRYERAQNQLLDVLFEDRHRSR